MHEIRHSVCPHDCPSQCALVVTVDDGRVTEVGGDPSHPFTTRPGLAVIEGIWWSKHQAGGRGVNVIADDRLADMGGGPALHSNLVQVARL